MPMIRERARGAARDGQPIDLPKPALEQSRSLARALQQRRTTREISDKQLALQTLSDLLWAACGVNPEGSPGMGLAEFSVF
jgi:hypothetical protein